MSFLFIIISVVLVSCLLSKEVFAHGYVTEPPSRARMGQLGLQQVGSVQYEPQSLEALKGFPQGGPPDGQIASAGGKFGGILDEQSSTRWLKTDIYPGENTFTWHHTAPHVTTKWHYYITKQGWNQNAPLARREFEHIETINYGGAKPPVNVSHNVTIPIDRSGYHVVLAVWDVADTVNAFYQVIDLNVINSEEPGPGPGPGPEPTPPPAVQGVTAELENVGTVRVRWSGISSSHDVNGYRVYRSLNGGSYQMLATVNGTSYLDQNVTENSMASYYVVAFNQAGEGPDSQIVTVTIPGSIFEVTGLHTMSVQPRSVDLMWNAPADYDVRKYDIYRGENTNSFMRISSSNTTRATDNSVQPERTYYYYVVATNSMGETSKPSNMITVNTPREDNGGGEVPGGYPQWNSRAFYRAGDIVQYNGRLYRALVTHQGYGDPNWNPVGSPSLWRTV